MVYVFDTSSLRVLRNYYRDVFATFWERFEGAIDAGGIVSVREVLNELEAQVSSTWLWDWIRARRTIFQVPTPAETLFVQEIFKVSHFRALVGETQRLQGRPVADPFVVACAKVKEGCVVTEETFKPNAAKIPNVCEYFEVDCTNIEGFLASNGWRF